MVPLLTIGWKIAKGFDFLGYSFEPKGLLIAPKTLANFLGGASFLKYAIWVVDRVAYIIAYINKWVTV